MHDARKHLLVISSDDLLQIYYSFPVVPAFDLCHNKIMKMIYIADDERNILTVLQEFLTSAGFAVQGFLSGDSLYKAFQKSPCDLVILDIMMPGTDGLEICRKLREISNVPIIILTAKESELDHIQGLMQGGDDYITKPFSPSILVARIQALLRRTNMETPKYETFTIGDLMLSEDRHSVSCKGRPIDLSVTEFSLLLCLMRNADIAVSRSDLLNQVWGIDACEIETRVTDETVRRIRKKLKSAESKVKIKAVWGYGYQLETEE